MPRGVYKHEKNPKHALFMTGRKASEETRKKMRLARLGRKVSEETKNKLRGLKRTAETKLKISQAQSEDKGFQWKGDKAGVSAMHTWVIKWKGRPRKCEMCGTDKAKKYEWANVDHSYLRVLEDYMRMCTSCHIRYDIENNDGLKRYRNRKT